MDVVFNYVNFHVYEALGDKLQKKEAGGIGQSNFPLTVNSSFDVRAARGWVSIAYQVSRIGRVPKWPMSA